MTGPCTTLSQPRLRIAISHTLEFRRFQSYVRLAGRRETNQTSCRSSVRCFDKSSNICPNTRTHLVELFKNSKHQTLNVFQCDLQNLVLLHKSTCLVLESIVRRSRDRKPRNLSLHTVCWESTLSVVGHHARIVPRSPDNLNQRTRVLHSHSPLLFLHFSRL